MTTADNVSRDQAVEANAMIVGDFRNANRALIEAKGYMRNALSRGLNVSQVEDAAGFLKELIVISENIESALRERMKEILPQGEHSPTLES